MSMQKAASKTLAFRLLAVAATFNVSAALLYVSAPAARAATTGSVSGTVTDDLGNPVNGAKVTLEGGQNQTYTTGKDGTFFFAGVQPGDYTLTVNVVTFNSTSQSFLVTQDNRADLGSIRLVSKTVFNKPVVVHRPLTNGGDTQTDQQVTAAQEKREISQPNNALQATGLLNYKAGVTVDAGQYPHVRGSDGNQIDWSIDSIDLRDPITNQFATNLVTVGIGRSNIITGGADATYGGSAGAYLNQISVNGRDIARKPDGTYAPIAGFIENTNGPSHPWQYYGGDTQIGGVLLNKKLDYAVSSVVFKTHYANNTQIINLASSHDESGKFNYYASPNDQFTVYFAHGAENYNYPSAPNTLFFSPDQVQTAPDGTQYYSTVNADTQTDHAVQTYNLDHFTYKRNFGPAAFLQYRIFQLHQSNITHGESGGTFTFDRTNVTGNQLDYFNQLNKSNTFKAGLQYEDAKGSYRRQLLNVQQGVLDPTGKNGPTRYTDRTYQAYPQDFQLYLADQLQALQNKLVFNYGLRFNSVTFKLGDSKYADSIGQSYPGSYTTKSTDPRLGLAYTPIQDLTFRTSYTVNSQRPDERRIERLSPLDVGEVSTATSAADLLAQSKSAYAGQGYSHVNLSHSKDFDLGVEKGFALTNGLLKGTYNVSFTGYKKYGYDLAFLNSANYSNYLSNRFNYNNDGTQHASGFEFSFRKSQRTGHLTDWFGYVNYTNQVVRTNSSLFDTTYIPYFVNYEASNPFFGDSAAGPLASGQPDLRSLAHQEFAPSWDQRHTVAVVATKRINKLLESTFILDAGSGLPFFSGPGNDGNFGTSVASGFADVHTVTGGPAEFTQVPITLGGNLLPPVNPVVGYTGWHYKISINTNFYLSPSFNLFLNVDNVFDKKTPLTLATSQFSGVPYYINPTAQFPQGQQDYRSQSTLTPIFLTFGFRQRF
jgi:hypothetical protein